MEALLTLDEAAELLRIDGKRLRQLARRGRIGGAIILPSGETRFNRDAFQSWVESLAKGGTA